MRNQLYDGDAFEVNGRTFKVEFPYDDFGRLPWDDDGAGIVSDWTSRDKAPGERVLCSDHGSRRYYDFAATMRKAKRDGWGLNDEALAALTRKLGRWPTHGEIVAESVERDFDRMRRFCNDEWSYVGVVVTDEMTGQTDSIWGVESDCTDYLAELAHEMAEGMFPLAESIEAAGLELATD